MSGPIRALLFDLDGLVVDTELLYRSAFQAAAAAQGFELSDEGYAPFLGRTNEAIYAVLAERYGPGFDVDRFRAAWPESWRSDVAAGRAPLKPGVEAVLDELDARGVRAAVASSADRRDVELCLRTHGLLARFEAIVCGDEVARGKPAPDLFLAAAIELDVAPADCVVLEDAAAGVAAAVAAGMRAVMVPDLVAPTDAVRADALCVCPDLFAALEALRPQLPPPAPCPDSSSSSPS